MDRLKKLKKKSKTYEEFLDVILKWPKHYLYPDKLRWTKEDVRRYYHDN